MRPEGLPDDLWDDATGIKAGDLVSRYRDAEGKLAELTAAQGEIPADAAGYKLELPEGVTLPDGFKVELNPADPFLKQAQESAKAQGWSTKQWQAAVGMEAQRQVAQATANRDTYTAEVAKLGEHAQTRVTAARTWAEANLTKAQATALLNGMTSADGVQAVEAIIRMRAGPTPGTAPATPAPSATEGTFGTSRLKAANRTAA